MAISLKVVRVGSGCHEPTVFLSPLWGWVLVRDGSRGSALQLRSVLHPWLPSAAPSALVRNPYEKSAGLSWQFIQYEIGWCSIRPVARRQTLFVVLHRGYFSSSSRFGNLRHSSSWLPRFTDGEILAGTPTPANHSHQCFELRRLFWVGDYCAG